MSVVLSTLYDEKFCQWYFLIGTMSDLCFKKDTGLIKSITDYTIYIVFTWFLRNKARYNKELQHYFKLTYTRYIHTHSNFNMQSL